MAYWPYPAQGPSPKSVQLTANPTSAVQESALLDRAAAFPKFQSLSDLSAENLREISITHGVEFATALLYNRVKRSPPHSDFINKIEQEPPSLFKTARRDVCVAVVPAAFYKQAPNAGGDGKVVLEAANHLGFGAELIPVSSTGTLEENANSILDWLAKHNNQKVILVSLCKGGADVKFALGRPNAWENFRNVSSWINICGILNGSPVAEWLLGSRPRFFIAWLYCKCRGHNLGFIRELQCSPSGPLSRPLKLPASIGLINIVGFPLKRHLTNRFMRLCYQRISSLGPNDGGMLLAGLCSLPGVIYPVWGADHYLRPESRARQIISTLLQHLAAAGSWEEPYSGHEIPAIDRNVQTTSA
ncbi:MAG TPA: hypothetical protein VME24_01730 [Alphaproteobacteria bacterium]|nr:hypothetical protein [Alphaproteobacteria bacterium]